MNDQPEEKQSWWQRLSGGLKRTSASIGGAVADLVGVAELVEFKQFRRQRLAARVALAFVLVDVDSELSSHRSVSLLSALCRTLCSAVGMTVLSRRRIAKLYHITFAPPLCCQVKSYRA